MTATLVWRIVSAPTLLLVIVSLAVVMPNGARLSGATEDTFVQGDVNCDGSVDSVDSLQILRSVAGLSTSAACMEEASDNNCDDVTDSVDGLRILRFVAGLFNATPDACTRIGDPLPSGPPPEPLVVTLSGFGRVSAELGYEGGKLTTIGLDGTTFTLEIPEGALAGAEVISMTPVEAVDELPIAGGLVAAVDLQPSGLSLWVPAVLTVDPLVDVPAGDQTAFVISEGEFAQHPFVLDSEEMQLPLAHFSAAGVGAGEVASVAAPRLDGDAYAARVAPVVNDERAARIDGGSGDPGFEQDLAALIDAHISELIAALQTPVTARDVTAQGPACTVAVQVVPQALGYGSQAQAIGGGGSYLQQVFQALGSISSSLGSCREEAFDRCVDRHEINAVALILAYSRVMEALGIEESPSPLEEMVEKCARFQLVFEGEFCVDVERDDPEDDDCTGGIHYIFLVSQDLFFSQRITPGPEPLGEGLLEQVLGEWGPYQGCSGEMDSPGSVFQVLSGGVSMNLRQAVDPRTVPEVTLVINPGIPPETLELFCFPGDKQHTTLWWQKWCSWHQDELTPPFADTAALCFYNDEPDGWGFAITDWDRNFAYPAFQSMTKEYNRDHTQVGVLEIGWEKSDVTIIHKPIP